MSEMEYNEGKLYFITNDIEDFAKKFVETVKNQIQIPKCWDDELEWFEDNCIDFDFMILNDCLYKVVFEHKKAGEPPQINKWEIDDNGIISFSTYHYNGGASLEEVLEGNMKRGSKNDR